jgi:hypothetical protein
MHAGVPAGVRQLPPHLGQIAAVRFTGTSEDRDTYHDFAFWRSETRVVLTGDDAFGIIAWQRIFRAAAAPTTGLRESAHFFCLQA